MHSYKLLASSRQYDIDVIRTRERKCRDSSFLYVWLDLLDEIYTIEELYEGKFDTRIVDRARKAYRANRYFSDLVEQEELIRSGKISPSKSMESLKPLKEELEMDYWNNIHDAALHLAGFTESPRRTIARECIHDAVLDTREIIAAFNSGVSYYYWVYSKLLSVIEGTGFLIPNDIFNGHIEHIDDLNADLAECNRFYE